MTGAPPYNPQSPTQQSRYPAYSPPNKPRHFYPNNDQYQQRPPQTPPAFPQPNLSRSPHYSHAPSPLPGTLPPLNGNGPPPLHSSDPSSQYQSHSATGTPQYSLGRPYHGSLLPGNSASPYGPSTPSHAHPSSRPDSHPHVSPKKEPDQSFSLSHGVPSYSSSHLRESRPSSPPREVVCWSIIFLSHRR
jgi:DNA helicase INO80